MNDSKDYVEDLIKLLQGIELLKHIIKALCAFLVNLDFYDLESLNDQGKPDDLCKDDYLMKHIVEVAQPLEILNLPSLDVIQRVCLCIVVYFLILPHQKNVEDRNRKLNADPNDEVGV